MNQTQNLTNSSFLQSVKSKMRDYGMLIKFSLNLTVVFSATFGYLMALGSSFEWFYLFVLALGGFLITSSANAINQIIEKDYDKMMKRTANRPLSAGRMDLTEAVLIAGLTGISGLALIGYYFNTLAALLGAISLIAYAFVYTPLKRVSPIAVFVGAIPGALPILIGYVAALGGAGLNIIAYSLFAIQFLWQFPHFWAIGWLGYDDYKKAGFKLLGTKVDGRNRLTALQSLAYIIAMIVVSLIPTIIGITSWITVVFVLVLGSYFAYTAIRLARRCDNPSALKMMFASFYYLPIVQIVMVLDKIF